MSTSRRRRETDPEESPRWLRGATVRVFVTSSMSHPARTMRTLVRRFPSPKRGIVVEIRDVVIAETMPLERLEAEITQLAGDLAAAECRWMLLIAEFDRRAGHEQWG